MTTNGDGRRRLAQLLLIIATTAEEAASCRRKKAKNWAKKLIGPHSLNPFNAQRGKLLR